jgi:hypothetical protein
LVQRRPSCSGAKGDDMAGSGCQARTINVQDAEDVADLVV